MKVFVAGATGELGRPTVAALVAAGHRVTGVARTPAKADLLRRLGADSVAVDLFDAPAVKAAVAGHGAVLHLATKIPPASKGWRRSAWAENDRLRSEATRYMLDGAQADGIDTFVMESIAFLYADGGDAWLDENAPLDPGTNTSMPEAEQHVASFTAAGGRGLVLRFGWFYGPDASHTRDSVRAARLGVAPLMGDPAGYVSSIHVADAGAAVAEATVSAPAGIWNVCDEPVTKEEYARVLGEAVARKKTPRTMGKLLTKLGGEGAAVLTRSHRVSNERFRGVTGWTPAHPSVREGLPEVVAQILNKEDDDDA
jgi:nucleoside-diphosphate-sugar epimerase